MSSGLKRMVAEEIIVIELKSFIFGVNAPKSLTRFFVEKNLN